MSPSNEPTPAASDPKSGRKKRRKKSPFRSGLLLLIVASLAALFVFAEFLCDGLISWALSTAVTETTGARIEIRQSDVSVLSAGLSLEDMDLFPYFETDEALFHAKRASASLDLAAALSGRVWIPELSLVGGVVTLRRDESGRLNIDPGPPPSDAVPEPGAPPPLELPESPDIIQQTADLLDRLERYRGYYEKIRKQRQEDAARDKARERVYPGQASYLATHREDPQPRLWIKRIEARDLRLVTYDARTGQPFLPIDKVSLLVENLTENTSLTGVPVRCELKAHTPRAGNWVIRYASARKGSGTAAARLSLALSEVPFESVASLVTKSLPFSMQGGTLALETVARKAAIKGRDDTPSGPIRIKDGKVQGAVRLRLDKVMLLEGGDSDRVLGLPGATFRELFNYALGQASIDLLFAVDGRLSRPRISLLNGRKLLETLKERALGAGKEKIRALANQVTAEVQARVAKQIQEIETVSGDTIEEAADRLDQQLGGALRGAPLGEKITPKSDALKIKSGKATEKAGEKVEGLLDRGKSKLGGLLGGDKDEKKSGQKKSGKGSKKNPGKRAKKEGQKKGG